MALSDQGELAIVLEAARQQASLLDQEARNPFTVLAADTSARASIAWAAKRRAEAEAIRAAIARLSEGQ